MTKNPPQSDKESMGPSINPKFVDNKAKEWPCLPSQRSLLPVLVFGSGYFVRVGEVGAWNTGAGMVKPALFGSKLWCKLAALLLMLPPSILRLHICCSVVVCQTCRRVSLLDRSNPRSTCPARAQGICSQGVRNPKDWPKKYARA